MGTKHDALLGLGTEHTYDVLSVNALVVEQTCPEVLHDDRVGKLIQLSGKPVGTIGMGLGLRHTRPEAGLLGHKLLGRVRVKVWNDYGFLRLFSGGWCSFGLLVATRGKKQGNGYDDECFFHLG